MSIDFADSTGNLFNRLGKHYRTVEIIEAYQKTTLDAAVTDTLGQYASDFDLVDGLPTNLTASQNAANKLKTQTLAFASKTLVEMVNDDNPLTEKTELAALRELIRQMIADAQTVDASAVTVATVADGGNNGDGSMLVSVKNGKDNDLENVLAEDIVVTCTSDSQPGRGNLLEGSEIFTAKGEAPVERTDFNFPKGSNGSTTVPLSNPAVDSSSANFLTNGNFEDFTAGDPDNWTIQVGDAAGSVDETSTAFKGSKALQFLGDGAELTKITQQLRLAGSTAGQFQPLRRYAFAFQVRVSVVPAAGVLRISLRDGIAGALIGTAITVDLTAEGTSYVFKSVQLVTPDPLPDQIHMVIELTTALESGKSVFIDHFACREMTQHQGGPLMVIFPGAIRFIVGDFFTVTPTNDRAGKFQEFFERNFRMSQIPLLLPSNNAGGETISDGLIG